MNGMFHSLRKLLHNTEKMWIFYITPREGTVAVTLLTLLKQIKLFLSIHPYTPTGLVRG